jgi:hypothetical protein
LIYQLLKLDGTWKKVVGWALAGAVGSLLISRTLASPDSHNTNSFIGIYFVWFFSSARARAATFHIALPIPGRQVFLAQIISNLSPFWALSIAVSVVAHFYGPLSHSLAMEIMLASSAITLCFCILHSVDLKEQKASTDMMVVAVSIFILLSICLMVVISLFPEASGLWAVLLIPSVFLFVYILIKTPKSFLLSETSAARLQNSYAEAPGGTKRDPLFLAWRPIFRSLFFGPFLYGCYLPLFFLFLCARHFSMVVLFALWVAMIWIQMRQRMDWAYAFPISRSIVLPLVLAPIFLLTLTGYFLGISLLERFSSPPQISAPADMRQVNKTMWNTWPPREFWQLAPGGIAPLIQAPWGETFQPPTIRDRGLCLYNPYVVGDQNSAHFYEWQFARGTQAIYGRAIPLSEFQGPGITHRRVIYPWRMKIIHISLILAITLIVISFEEILGWRAIPLFIKLSGCISIVLGAGSIALFSSPGSGKAFVEYADSLPLRISWILPDNMLFVVAILAASLVALYWIANRLHREGEC